MKISNSWMIAALLAGLCLDQARAHGSGGPGMTGRAFGVFAGPINNFPDLKGVDGESRIGTSVGLIGEWGVHRNFAIALEPMLTWRGPSITNGAGYEPDVMVLEIPVTVRRNWLLGDHSRIYIFAGPDFAFPMSAEGNIAGGTALAKDDLKPFEFLIDGGIGATLRIVDYWHLLGNVRYSHGFTEVLEDPIGGVDGWKTRNVKFLFGILHHIPGT